jgi:hypothetical protein
MDVIMDVFSIMSPSLMALLPVVQEIQKTHKNPKNSKNVLDALELVAAQGFLEDVLGHLHTFISCIVHAYLLTEEDNFIVAVVTFSKLFKELALSAHPLISTHLAAYTSLCRLNCSHPLYF